VRSDAIWCHPVQVSGLDVLSGTALCHLVGPGCLQRVCKRGEHRGATFVRACAWPGAVEETRRVCSWIRAWIDGQLPRSRPWSRPITG